MTAILELVGDMLPRPGNGSSRRGRQRYIALEIAIELRAIIESHARFHVVLGVPSRTMSDSLVGLILAPDAR